MAEKFGFLKIGEANAAIEKLTKERDDLKVRAEAAEENATKAADEAEKARKDSEGAPSIQKQLDDEKAAHLVTKQQLEKATADLKAEQEKTAKLPEKIKEEGAKEAARITASLGQPPIANTPATAPAAPAKVELKGLAKTKAAFAAQLKPAATL